MRMQGVRVLDPVLETCQVDWLVISARDCPDEASERRISLQHFRVPHKPWGPDSAFVEAVTVRRGRFRVLFRQESGVRLQAITSEAS
ncbi:MAG: hypothetical protein HQ582_28050 [Planctomycetes bacterium]|nr:hypothetical protein [Planctomycetota bacterium]